MIYGGCSVPVAPTESLDDFIFVARTGTIEVNHRVKHTLDNFRGERMGITGIDIVTVKTAVPLFEELQAALDRNLGETAKYVGGEDIVLVAVIWSRGRHILDGRRLERAGFIVVLHG